MQISKARELKEIILGIYYGDVDPQKFKELTGRDYKEELYPESDNVYLGEWLSKYFDFTTFVDKEEIARMYKYIGQELNLAMRFANIPEPETIQDRVNKLLEAETAYVENTN